MLGKFSLQVPEADVNGMPSILEQREAESAEMGALARRQWEEWFAPDVLFHRMAEGCRDIMEKRRTSNPAWPDMFNRRFLYLLARSMKSRVRSRLGTGFRS